jgi:hypothetical protein
VTGQKSPIILVKKKSSKEEMGQHQSAVMETTPS